MSLLVWLSPVVLLSFGFCQLFKWSQRQHHSGCGVVLVDNLFAHYVWKERLGRSGRAGLGALSMLLIV